MDVQIRPVFSARGHHVRTPTHETVLDCLEAGIEAAHPSVVVPEQVHYDARTERLTVADGSYDLSAVENVYVIGGGNATGAIALALESALGDRIDAGAVVTDEPRETTTIETLPGDHPIPSERGVDHTAEMCDLAARTGSDDLVLAVVGGGGSALMTAPVEAVSLASLRGLTDELLRSGATIDEINAVRKHLSEVKGGRLGRFFAPARVVSVIISDVLGNDLDVIASGPTVPDRSSYRDALDVLEKYGLRSDLSRSVCDRLEGGAAGTEDENPRNLPNCHNYIIADNRVALEAMENEARGRGLSSRILTCRQTGRPEEVARGRAFQAISGEFEDVEVVLLGGETTPALPDNHGKGGRNQHYAAASVLAMDGYPGPWTVASVGTDGSDYISGVAGAIVDQHTAERARERGLDIRDYVERYDSYTLFEELGGSLIKTGDTGTNVCDIAIYLLGGGQDEAAP